MKLPSLWPVLSLAAGIFVFRTCATHAHLTPRLFLITAASLLLVGLLSLRQSWLLAGGLAAAAAWLCLGFAAAGLERASSPVNLASTLIETGKVDSSVPLRWRGRLRADPLQLPWGIRYEIDLDEVESASGVVPVSGTLRMTLYRDASSAAVPAAVPAAAPAAATMPPVRAGDRVEALVRALPIRNFENPGSFDARAYYALQGIVVQGSLRKAELLTVLDHPRLTISERLARVRGRLLGSIDELLASHPDQAALARAMLLGDRSFVEHDRVVEYQQTGVYHVLVLAGLHVAALTAFIIWAGRRLRLELLSRTLLTLCVIAAYVGIVEDRPPILRAALMAAIYLCARLFYRRMELLNVAALAALIILAAKPSELSDASFLLSFSAVGIIGALAVPWMAATSTPYLHGLAHISDVSRDVSYPPRVIQFRIELRAAGAWLATKLPGGLSARAYRLLTGPLRMSLWIWELVVLSAILQLGMLPPMAYYFHRVTLAGPMANIPALLLTGLIVPLGFLTLVASLASKALAEILAKALSLLLEALDASVHWFAHWRLASYRIPNPPIFSIVIFVIAAIGLSAAIRQRRRAWQWVCGIALLSTAAVIATYPFAPHIDTKDLEVTVLDVGQGDSLFVAFPGGRTMLVDGGGEIGSFSSHGMTSGIDIGEEVVCPYLWSRGIKQIEVVALTHAHEDHLGGLTAVLKNFPVRELWVGRDIKIAAYDRLLALARERGVRIVHMKEGDTFARGNVSGSVLWPADLNAGRAAENDDSLVMRLSDGSRRMLLTGDIERPSEQRILADAEPVDTDFLKIAHHGSKTSTTPPFLASSHPIDAAISVGRENSFGHPSPEVIDRLEAAGVHVYRTDRDGAITVVTDGQSLTVSTFIPHDPATQHFLSAARPSVPTTQPSP